MRVYLREARRARWLGGSRLRRVGVGSHRCIATTVRLCRRSEAPVWSIPLHGILNHENSIAFTVYQPRGVIAAIIPFNYPVELWSHKVAGGIAAGNAVITKPPEECPLAMLKIAAYFEEEGLPPGVHQMLTGYGEVVGAHFARSHGVQMISMTGSTEVGKIIMRDAADSLKKVHLELGGNDATIIMETSTPRWQPKLSSPVASPVATGRSAAQSSAC